MNYSIKISRSGKSRFFLTMLLLYICRVSSYSQNFTTDDDYVHNIATVMPTFPGGDNELSKYLFERNELNDSKYKDHGNIRNTVVFVIKKDGTIVNPEVAEDETLVDPELAKHSLQIVKSMPKWIPGEHGGKKVDVKKILVIRYRFVSKEIYVKPAIDFVKIGAEKEALKDYAGACIIYDNVLKIDPNNVVALQKRSVLKEFYLQDFSGALADYNTLIKAFPDRSIYYLRRGTVQQELLQDEKAMADYDKAILLDPENADAYYKRGQLKYLNKLKIEGCEDLKKADQLGSEEAAMALAAFCD